MGKYIRTMLVLCMYFAWIEVAIPAQAADPTPTPLGSIRVIVSSAGIRNGPGFNYSAYRYATLGDEFTIYGQSNDGTWYLIDIDHQRWIAAKQVERIGQLFGEPSQIDQSLIPAEESTDNTPSSSPLSDLLPEEISIVSIDNLPDYINQSRHFINEIEDLLPQWVVIGFKVWGIALLVPLIALKIRWFFGSLVFGITLGPLGWIISIVIAGMILFGNWRIKDSSPRELLQDMVGWGPIQAFLVILFFVVTAFSILGGVIIFAYLAVFYGIVLVLLPGRSRRQKGSLASINSTRSISSSTGSYESSYPSHSSYDDSDYDRSYDGYDRDYDRDNDRDDDDGDKGSIWDGWLVKW